MLVKNFTIFFEHLKKVKLFMPSIKILSLFVDQAFVIQHFMSENKCMIVPFIFLKVYDHKSYSFIKKYLIKNLIKL